jgi:uncharacterized protein (DUF1810 family)
VKKVENRSAHEIFGSPDDMKLHSSLTLFLEASKQDENFRQTEPYNILKAALKKYFNSKRDQSTMELLDTFF